MENVGCCSALPQLPSALDGLLLLSLRKLGVSGDGGFAGLSEKDGLVGNSGVISACAGSPSSDQDRSDGEDDELSCCSDECSDDDGFWSASMASDMQLFPKSLGCLTVRDGLLAEAWERRRERALAGLGEQIFAHSLERSSSDCGDPRFATERGLLIRSASDVGKDGSPAVPVHSITDDDFEELKGCIDLGFCFDESSLPAFSHTLPALQVYCAVAQSLQESPYSPSMATSPARHSISAASTSPWRVCSPGDASEDVKGRLRHWARAVACNARLC